MGPLKHQLFSSFLGGQFGPVCTGQFEPVTGGQFQPARVVNLNRILQFKFLILFRQTQNECHEKKQNSKP